VVRSNPGRLAIARDPEHHVAPISASGGLPCAEVSDADTLERHLEALRVVTAVVSRRAAVLQGQTHVPGKLVGLNEVPPANLARLEAELPRDQPDHESHYDDDVVPSGAPGALHHT